jgi:GntR family transcriptional regulator
MRLQVDVHSGVPIYIQIVERVKHMIATGELKPGDQLPTVRQLAQDLLIPC